MVKKCAKTKINAMSLSIYETMKELACRYADHDPFNEHVMRAANIIEIVEDKRIFCLEDEDATKEG